jgi:hypothetical protein
MILHGLRTSAQAEGRLMSAKPDVSEWRRIPMNYWRSAIDTGLSAVAVNRARAPLLRYRLILLGDVLG